MISPRAFLAIVVGMVVLGLAVAHGGRSHDDLEAFKAPPAVSNSGLADRINHACKPGFQVYDWSTGDEYHPVAKGIVEVTCVRWHQDGNFDQYKTAVPR